MRLFNILCCLTCCIVQVLSMYPKNEVCVFGGVFFFGGGGGGVLCWNLL